MKSKTVYEGIFYLAFLLFITASVLCYFMIKDAKFPEEINTSMTVCCAVEVFLVVSITVSIIKGASRLFAETKSIGVVKDLYERIQFPSMFAIAYGIMQIVVSEFSFGGLLFYGLNMMGLGLIFFVWMKIKIYKINKQTRL